MCPTGRGGWRRRGVGGGGPVNCLPPSPLNSTKSDISPFLLIAKIQYTGCQYAISISFHSQRFCTFWSLIVTSANLQTVANSESNCQASEKRSSLTGCREKSADAPCLEAPPATNGSDAAIMQRASREDGSEKTLIAALLPLPAETTGRGFCVRISAGCEVVMFCRLALGVSREVEG